MLDNYTKYGAEDEILWAVQKYVSDFRWKLTPGVIQMKKRHNTTRN